MTTPIMVVGSVPHTGTVFLTDMLRAHPEVEHFVYVDQFRKQPSMMLREISPGAWEPGIMPDVLNVVQGHWGAEGQRLLQMLSIDRPLAIPMRDPLATLISCVNRQPRANRNRNLSAWCELADCVYGGRDLYEPVYFPIDLIAEMPPDERVLDGQMLVEALFESACPDEIVRYLEAWEPKNVSEDVSGLRAAYNEGDLPTIRRAIPREYEALLSCQPVLRPMLEEIGYTDLLWYT